jgi:hypothetical protein
LQMDLKREETFCGMKSQHQKKIVGLLMSPSMMKAEVPERDFQVLAYHALVD